VILYDHKTLCPFPGRNDGGRAALPGRKTIGPALHPFSYVGVRLYTDESRFLPPLEVHALALKNKQTYFVLYSNCTIFDTLIRFFK
jgi:hypothetical protein